MFLGAASYVNDYVGVKSHANCTFQFNPQRGPNKGLISLVVQTKNMQGVAAGRELVVTYGPNYQHMEQMDAVPCTFDSQ